MSSKAVITRTVWILGLVSLFTDMASEMLYPVMPVYLEKIGFSILLIGVLEGLAEALAGLSKGYFGKWSDNSGRRLPFVQIGYFLSAVSKPLIVLFVQPIWVFFTRSLDRLGKGIRTGARDALLSESGEKKNKGQIFGFHRSMDTLGAAIGPGIALAYLYYHPGNYEVLFAICLIPGLLAVAATWLLKEKIVRPHQTQERATFKDFWRYWKRAPKSYKKVVTGLLLFALINSSDLFLLLNAKHAGMSDTQMIAYFIFYNLVYALAAYPLGKLGDRIGLKKVLIAGLVLFALVYALFAVAEVKWYGVAFLGYGIFYAGTYGIAKAWISNLIPKKESATALGTFSGFQSFCTLIASTLAGVIWYYFGSTTIFLITALGAMVVAIYFVTLDLNLKQQ